MKEGIVFELTDGQKVEMRLSFGVLYKLRANNKDLYEKYNKIYMNGAKDAFDFILIMYTAYCCAKIEDLETCMTEEDFISLIPFDMGQLSRTCQELLGAKKK